MRVRFQHGQQQRFPLVRIALARLQLTHHLALAFQQNPQIARIIPLAHDKLACAKRTHAHDFDDLPKFRFVHAAKQRHHMCRASGLMAVDIR